MLIAATSPAARRPAPQFWPKLSAILLAVVLAVAVEEVVPVALAEVEEGIAELEVPAGAFFASKVPH